MAILKSSIPYNINEMMIVTGPTGSGKSMFQMMFIGRQLAETDHTIITNLPLKFAELEAVTDEEFGTDWRKHGALRDRIYHTENYREFRRFWLIKGFGWCVVDIEEDDYELGYKPDYSVHFRYIPRELKPDELKKRKPLYTLKLPEVLKLEEAGEVERRDAEGVPEVDVIIDEGRSYFPQLSKGKLGPSYVHFLDHKRKLRMSVLIGCQFPKQLDSEIRSAANTWVLLQCFAKRRKGMFYLPKQSVWQLYPGPGIPGEHDQPDRKGFFPINGDTWGRTYDTAAGVGLPGGHVADAGAKIGGISWKMFPVIVVALLLLSFVGLRFGKIGFTSIAMWILGRSAHASSSAQAAVVPTNVVQVAKLTHAVETNSVASKEDDRIGLSGVSYDGGRLRVWFADGSVVSSSDPEFGGVIRVGSRITGVKYGGRTYHLRDWSSSRSEKTHADFSASWK